MDDKEIYKKTLTFSLRRLAWAVGCLIVIIIFMVAGLFIASAITQDEYTILGVVLGMFLGLIVVGIASHFVSYVFKAGQIAMMTKGVTEGKLPDDVYGEGKKIVKERFLTVAAFYAVTRVITGIFNQIGTGITKIGESVGGKNGGYVGSAIAAVINTIVRYLCDCCLGWVFFKSDTSSFKATLEGAVLFFKNGKTLLKNLGRIFGISIVSFLVIGGVFFGISFGICNLFPDFFAMLAEKLSTADIENAEFLSDATNVMMVFSAFIGISFWSIIHSAFVRPYILIGVLRNYINAGKEAQLSEDDYNEVASKSPKFKKLQEKEA